MSFPIAIELLEIEHERLLRDHYDTAPTASFKWTCDGCIRARDVKQELDELKNGSKRLGEGSLLDAIRERDPNYLSEKEVTP